MTLKELNEVLDEQIKILKDQDQTNPSICMRNQTRAKHINELAKTKVNLVQVALQNEKVKGSNKGVDDLIG